MTAEDTNSGSGLERIIMFSDAVIAIAITLLVLDIRLPPIPEATDNAGLLAALGEIAPKIEAYVTSFLIVGQFWYSHHVRFRFIRRYDNVLIWINLLFLMVIGFVPFASLVRSEHPVAAAYILYDGTMALAALLSASIWGYAIAGNRLVSADLAPWIRRQSLVSPLLVAAIFGLSGALTLLDLPAERWVWLLLIPAVLTRSGGRERLRSRAEPPAAVQD